MRSAPSSARARAWSRALPSVMRATCRWVLMAVSGLRNSWAASPVRRRSRSMALPIRWSNWFWVSSKGCSSLGNGWICKGSRESALRRIKASRMRLSGASPWPMPSQSRHRQPSSATPTGTEAASRIDMFNASRSICRSAVVMRRSPRASVKLRHGAPSII
ncbi:hypothetical protein D3C78_1295250 [compost metagenome]